METIIGLKTALKTQQELQDILNKNDRNIFNQICILFNYPTADETNFKVVYKTAIRFIIDEYKQGNNEPLDGDDVDALVDILRNNINFIEGNITKQEFEKN